MMLKMSLRPEQQLEIGVEENVVSWAILATSVLCLFNEPYGSNGPSHGVEGKYRLAEET